MFGKVSMQGWAIPQVKSFRYSYEQKKFLYDIFMDGQKTGKKSSPEEVEQRVRQHFSSTKDYVTAKQIRSLFSTFARQLKDNTLVEPTPYILKISAGTTSSANTPKNVELENSEEVEKLENRVEEDLMEVAEDIIARISTWIEGMWVVVRTRRRWLPGRIVSSDDVDFKVVEDSSFVVDLMERMQNSNKFRWPQSRDIRIFDRDDILLSIATETMTQGDIVWCQLSDSDYDDANQALKKLLREDID